MAKDQRRDQTIHQELRQMLEDQSGLTCSLQIATIKRDLRSTMEINSYGLHYRTVEIWRI